MTKSISIRLFYLFLGLSFLLQISCKPSLNDEENIREKISIDDDWKFFKYNTIAEADKYIYDVRPEVIDEDDSKVADSKPTEAITVEAMQQVLKDWILPTANNFIKDSLKHYKRPDGNPGGDFPFVKNDFDDSTWEHVNLPHDWGIKGPFLQGWDAEVGGGMGRLASHGVAWYRKKLDIPMSDTGKSIFLDIDGIMSYAMVWVNGTLAGGWPYGYNSWQIDLTPFLIPGGDNQIAIRVDNPPSSARWYPGGGIYRNMWLTKTNPVHINQWGTFMTTKNVSKASAVLDLELNIKNDSKTNVNINVVTHVYELDSLLKIKNKIAIEFPTVKSEVKASKITNIKTSVELQNPLLWGPPPTQTPNLYKAISKVYSEGKLVDIYETRFGIRSLDFTGDNGLIVNGEKVLIKGVNQHHDLGALGAAFNTRAAERQLELLQELGCNAIRMAHNPPAPELLELTDKMGFLVVNEIFDVWERKKTPLDFHLIFPDWHEADTRSFVRRDRNCPSVIMWSFGNEVGEQYTEDAGAAIATKLANIIKEEDPTRPSTASMNFAKPFMPFPQSMDIISLNYQGEGIRNAPAYSHLKGINTQPLYPAFHEKFPGKMILSSETASALSTRSTYLFPVFSGNSAPIADGAGGDPETKAVSAYELYTAPFGSSADKVFASQDMHPYVSGEFVWTGWDYLGEPTPYYLSRSSYSGIIDLAGFKKDRFYLYQARWRPNLPMAHILPHWNWPERIGRITPVHIFTSGDEAALFLNGKSLGKKKKQPYEYRLRWDDVVYEPGELKVIAYKNGHIWAENIVKTTSEATTLTTEVDRNSIIANGEDLAFITIKITDKNGLVVPTANNSITVSIEGAAELVATDNGDPSNLVAFSSKERAAYNGLLLAIVRSKKGIKGTIKITAKSNGLETASIEIKSN